MASPCSGRTKPEAISYGFDDGGDVGDARLLRVVIQGIPIINTYVPQGLRLNPRNIVQTELV